MGVIDWWIICCFWFIVRVSRYHKVTSKIKIRVVSQYSMQISNCACSAMLWYEWKRFCLYGYNYQKCDDENRFLTQFSIKIRTHTQNIKHVFKQNLFITGYSLLVLSGNVWFRRNHPVFRSNHQGFRQKLNYNIQNNAIRQGKSIYLCHIQGLSLNFVDPFALE